MRTYPILLQSAAPVRDCRGQGTIEFLLAAVPVLLLGLGSIEAIHWQFTRQAVSHALMQAARAGITQGANPAVIDNAFATALLPLHAGPTAAASRARLERSIERRERSTLLPAWHIQIASPSSAAFEDFASESRELLLHSSLPIIDNDYLHEQHLSRLSQGWPDGRGPASGLNTLQANTLVLRLVWLHEPLLPGVRNLIRQLAPDDDRYGSLGMRRGGFLPIHREVAMVMQSHAQAWPMPPHGRVTRALAWQPLPGSATQSADVDPAPPVGAGTQEPARTEGHDREPVGTAPDGSLTNKTDACVGLWCLREFDAGGGVRPEHDFSPGIGREPQGQHGGKALPTGPEGSEPVPGDIEGEASASEREPSLIDPDDCPGCCN